MEFNKEKILKIITENGYLINEEDITNILLYNGNKCLLLQEIFSILKENKNLFFITKKEINDALKIINNKNLVKIICDVTNESLSKSDYNNFISYFNDRYNKLSNIIKNKLSSYQLIKNIKNTSKKNTLVSIICIITEKKYIDDNKMIINVEDPTGFFTILIDKKNEYIYNIGLNLILDEVIGITGTLYNDIIFVSKITFPDIPDNIPIKYSNGQILFLSDIHIGSKMFMEDEWNNFIDFINGKNESLKKLSQEIKYIIVAGDLVDGIGIYPNQEIDLKIPLLNEQYRTAGEYFRKIPSTIKIIIAPGNHDGVRKAEPQPSLKKKYGKYFSKNVIFVSNPSLIEIDNIPILIYHGCSIDDLVSEIRNVTYQNPTSGMKEMILRRHLCPIYGKKTIIAPEEKDYMVIEKIPQILHCGHIHTLGIEKYKNITLINSGTWQRQTDFQKKVNIVPNPAKVPILNLKNGKMCILNFNKI